MKIKFSLMSFIFCLFYSMLIIAAPQKDLWPYWQTDNPHSTQKVDHHLYQDFLIKYIHTDINNVNLVSYSKVNAKDKHQLNNYINYLTSLKITDYNKQEQLAYWINLYNALTIKVVLDRFPTKSILDIRLSGIFTPGPWNKKLIKIENKELSLNDIEHRIIRPIWNDPRTHFALNCASYSCPNLQKTAYTGANIQQVLNADAKEYLNSSRGVNIDNDNNLIVSEIFEWYASDFGKNDTEIIQFIGKYANPALKQKLTGRTIINKYTYDWSLNGN